MNPSLLLIPDRYKAAKLYSQIPDSGAGDLTFARNSNATRVNSAGLIEKVRTNIQIHSQNFSNAVWVKSAGATLTHSQTDPNGGTTASRLQMPSGTSNFLAASAISGLTNGGKYTHSIFMRSNTGSTQSVRFMDGVRGVAGGTLTASVTTSWQRFEVVITTASTSAGLQIDNQGGAFANDILIAFAQTEESDFGATPYIPTTTAAVSVGITADIPRLDYTGGGCPSLLLEPQRTNLLNYSEQFNSTPYWDLGSAATITANSVISPDGTLSADTLTANGAGQIYVRNNVYLGTAQTCSSSIFVKKANNRYVGLRNSGTISNHDVFDFDTKTWTNNSGATLSYDELSNGWFRLKSTNTDAVNLNYYWSVIPAVNTSGLENTTASNLSVYIWGGQAEQNASYATSYIPTLGSSVTRLADAASKTGISSLIGQTEGTIFLEVDFTNISGVQVLLSVHDGALNKRFEIWADSAVLNGFIGGSVNIAIGSTTITNGSHKIALAYKQSGDQAFYVDGVQIGISATPYTIAALTSLSYSQYTGTLNPNEGVKQTLLFKTRLTNAELQSLTAL
jgi:hypothetical protein